MLGARWVVRAGKSGAPSTDGTISCPRSRPRARRPRVQAREIQPCGFGARASRNTLGVMVTTRVTELSDGPS